MVGGSFMLVFSWNELSYDRYHENRDRIFRLSSVWMSEDTHDEMSITSGSVGDYLKTNYPFIEETARIAKFDGNPALDRAGKTFQNEDFYYVDPSIMEVFTFRFVAGSREQALQNPGDLAINTSWAIRLFGTTDCVGRPVRSDGQILQVSAVFEDLPQNVDQPINGMMYPSFPEDTHEMFGFSTYVLLKDGTPSSSLAAALKIAEDDLYGKMRTQIELRAQALAGLHFVSGIKVDNPKGSLLLTRLILFAGLLVFLLVMVNTTNLNVIRSLDRMKRAAIHRILGARKGTLIKDFVLELVMLWVGAVFVSLTLIEYFRDAFKSLTGVMFTGNYELITYLFFLVTLFVLVMSGVYSMWYTLQSRPSDALRKFIRVGMPGAKIRKYLVGIQVTLSCVMIATLFVLMAQQQYLLNKDLGFQPEGVFTIRIDEESGARTAITNELQAIAPAGSTTFLWRLITDNSEMAFQTYGFTSVDGAQQDIVASDIDVDPSYFDVVGIRVFSGVHPREITESQGKVAYLNQTLAQKLKPQLEGLKFNFQWQDGGLVKGVVNDFHFQSLHNQIEPLVLVISPDIATRWNLAYVRADAEKIADIERELLRQFPDDIIETGYLNEKLMRAYDQERTTIKMLGAFMLMGVFLAIVGLFGVLSYVLRYKLFEIGIRRVLGARIRHLLGIFGREFSLVTILALGVSLPLSFYIKDRIFESYAYIVDLSTLWYVLPTALILLLMFSVFWLVARRADKADLTSILRQE